MYRVPFLMAMSAAWLFSSVSALAAGGPSALFCENSRAVVALLFQREEIQELQTTLLLLGGASQDMFSPKILRRLRAYLKTAGKTADLSRTENLQLVLESIRGRISPEDYRMTTGNFLAQVSAHTDDFIPAYQPLSYYDHVYDDADDYMRGWGWQLLPDNDPAFFEPEYLSKYLTQHRARGNVFGKPEWGGDALEQEWMRELRAASGVDSLQLEGFYLTGSDANSAVYQLAQTARRRARDPNWKHAEVLSFKGSYMGARGRAGLAGEYGTLADEGGKSVIQTNPVTRTWGLNDEALIATEKRALEEIEERIDSLAVAGNPVGAMIIEPIGAHHGVWFYRPKFLLELQRLLAAKKIPLVADEILTGGGRTGKFFAYQHYSDFTPDFVTFGKGLQMSGLLSVNGDLSLGRMIVTLQQYNEPLLKSIQILKAIRERKLIENAAKMGDLLVAKARKLYRARFRKSLPPEVFYGKGLLIHTEDLGFKGKKQYLPRLLPPLTITPDEIKKLEF